MTLHQKIFIAILFYILIVIATRIIISNTYSFKFRQAVKKFDEFNQWLAIIAVVTLISLILGDLLIDVYTKLGLP